MQKGLIIIAVFLSSVLQAQVKVSGKVTDNKKKPLAGVSIALKNTYDGATTDSAGNFMFETTEKGAQVLEATSSGYRTFEQAITIGNDPVAINIALKELVTELKAVVITAGSFEASDKKKTTVLTPLDIVTTASANGDITGALKTLPGTQQVGESEGLFVRGGTATESKIYIDGALVNNFFYSSTPGIATRGRFNPFLFKGTVFSAGGYSALYGQALSSALILESRDLPDQSSADFGASVVGLGGGLQKLAKNKKSSWGFSYNYTDLHLAFAVIKQKQDFFQLPVFHQLDANFRIKTQKGGFVKYYGYYATNKVGFRNPDIDSAALKDAFELKNSNMYHNLSWKERIGKGWGFNVSLSYSNNKDDINNETQDGNNQKQVITSPIFYAFKNFSLKNDAQYAQARGVLEKKLKGLSAVRFGSDYFYSNEKTTFTLYTGTRFTESVKDNLTAVFGEADLYITNDLAVKAGGRLEHSALMDKVNIAPRLSLAYKFKDNSQASFAYGIFYQNPERRYLPAAVSGLDFAKATHYILQYQKTSKDYTFRTELFYKKYNALYKTAPNSIGREVAAGTNGNGYAQGFELFWRDKKTLKDVDYWISYSYLDTKRDFLNYPKALQPSFAATHTANFVVKKFVLPIKTQFNANYSFASGRPYYRIAYNNAQSKYEVTDAGKTISYNSLSFSVNYLPGIGKKNAKAFAVWVLGINNVLGQKQVFSYNYSTDGSRKEEVTPPSKRFVFIACFISFGIDRTKDAINNNL
jgi:vitamin B12 transporter